MGAAGGRNLEILGADVAGSDGYRRNAKDGGAGELAEPFVPGVVGVPAHQVGQCPTGLGEPDVGDLAEATCYRSPPAKPKQHCSGSFNKPGAGLHR